ncbi:MAG: hypothetical protein M1814_002594 [Vezdaea aestivalis]|nr:MAG: hypothetical protein M1814_002594 [Vezdaea aestivalis]
MKLNNASVLAALIATASAFPTLTPRQAITVTPAQILSIMPAAGSCSGAQHLDECRTASQAAPFISQSFATYGIQRPGEAAALLSLMALESAEFKFNKNYFPGNPGQGTRNMQSAAFNRQYASSIPALAGQVATAASPNAVRELVLPDKYSFGSAAWFLTTNCPASIRTGLQTGSLAGWTAYITGCVGTTVTPERQAYYTKALVAMGVGAT